MPWMGSMLAKSPRLCLYDIKQSWQQQHNDLSSESLTSSGPLCTGPLSFILDQPSNTLSLSRYTNRDLPVVNLRGRFSSKPGEISSMITGLFSSQQSKTQISFKHLESLSFPKRESCTASVERMLLTVLTGEFFSK